MNNNFDVLQAVDYLCNRTDEDIVKYRSFEAQTPEGEQRVEVHMPTNEETIRRDIRRGVLIANEKGNPGRKGYTFTKQALLDYAKKRYDDAYGRFQRNRGASSGKAGMMNYVSRPVDAKPIAYAELLAQYRAGALAPEDYAAKLKAQKERWEDLLNEKQLQLAQVNVQLVRLQGDIQRCERAIKDYDSGIDKLN